MLQILQINCFEKPLMVLRSNFLAACLEILWVVLSDYGKKKTQKTKQVSFVICDFKFANVGNVLNLMITVYLVTEGVQYSRFHCLTVFYEMSIPGKFILCFHNGNTQGAEMH